MNPDHFRQLYEYHFAANHRLWERCILGLTAEQFRRQLPYSLGSVRNQVVHMMNMEDRWFCGLRGEEVPSILNPVYFGTAAKVRERWDAVEVDMRAYLARLDAAELARPFDEKAAVWQVLFHVLNHGTDHRAQTMAMLAQLGIKGFPQDYYLHLIGRW
jgi:uncharacterized damage-inducible protein DinB